MKITHSQGLIAAVLVGTLTFTGAHAETPGSPGSNGTPTPGFNNKIPDKILTPDRVAG